ncbi:MAG: radical SAM protein [Candidatus Omnitrophota bacterium]|jgi:putative pyruvate formate lyase activating enzyme
MYPLYLAAYQDGNLERAIEESFQRLKNCSICPRKCGVNRLKNEKGFCKTGLLPKVCSFMPHLGEEPPISGTQGSGTIFFSHCDMACVYCQNYEFSQLGQGREVDFEKLADFMLQLQNLGCHNLNLVTPTHVMPQILKALSIAIGRGLKLPIVYNTGGYELTEMIKLLEGIVDIYLPDMRYADNAAAIKYSAAPDYPEYNQAAVKEMQRQVGTAEIDNSGVIKRGLVIRHLVLPNNISGTEKIMKFISQEISQEAYISLMSQYLPYHKARSFKELDRRLTEAEYEKAKQILEKYGLSNGWVQESFGLERFAGIHIKPALGKSDEENTE